MNERFTHSNDRPDGLHDNHGPSNVSPSASSADTYRATKSEPGNKVQAIPTSSPSYEPTDAASLTHAQSLHVLEAAIFSANQPLAKSDMLRILPANVNLPALLNELEQHYVDRGITLCHNEAGWFFATAKNLGTMIRSLAVDRKPLTRATMETLAVIAWHQPVTRSEIEKVRGVSLSSGILDILMETELIRPLGRRVAINHPLEWGTTARFLQTFDLKSIEELPGLEELRKSGFMNTPANNKSVLGGALFAGQETVGPVIEKDLPLASLPQSLFAIPQGLKKTDAT